VREPVSLSRVVPMQLKSRASPSWHIGVTPKCALLALPPWCALIACSLMELSICVCTNGLALTRFVPARWAPAAFTDDLKR